MYLQNKKKAIQMMKVDSFKTICEKFLMFVRVSLQRPCLQVCTIFFVVVSI